MPKVQPTAVMTPARLPLDNPADTVKSTPVPGVATITSDSRTKPRLTQGSPFWRA